MNRKIVLRAVLVVFIALLLSVPLGVQPTALLETEEPTTFPDSPLGAQQQTEETIFPIDFVGK